MAYRVVGNHAVVTLGDPTTSGVVRILEFGAILPDEGVHESVLAHLVTVGQIEEFEPEPDEAEEPAKPARKTAAKPAAKPAAE